MMENIFSPPYRKLKLLLILPVFTLLFYAFARPDYQYAVQGGNTTGQPTLQPGNGKKVTGRLVMPDGKPLQGAHIIIAETTIGTVSDENGSFTLENVPEDAALCITYVGYKSKVIKSKFIGTKSIMMDADTISYAKGLPAVAPPPPPPPPPQPGVEKSEKGITPAPSVGQAIEPVVPAPSKEEIFTAVEEIPAFPGGYNALRDYIQKNLKHPGGVTKKGEVEVTFLVTKEGEIAAATVTKSLHPQLDLEAMRLVTSMPDWKPGMQNGKPVDVQMKLPVEF
jgi:hypothetical protein